MVIVTHVLFVCTANLCRSPLAEAIVSGAGTAPSVHGSRHPTGVLEARSAGVTAVPGMALHPSTADVLAQRGLTLPGFASRRLEPAHVERAELVLTATRAHRAACVALVPTAVRRCFTMKELSRLATVMQEQDLATERTITAVLRAVPVARSFLQPVALEEDDLADPVLMGPDAFAACADSIADLLAPVLGLVWRP